MRRAGPSLREVKVTVKASLALLLVLASLLAPAPAGAHVIAEPFLQSPVTVGQTGLMGELRLINEDEAGPSYSICNPGECNSQGVTLTPSCATHGAAISASWQSRACSRSAPRAWASPTPPVRE